jgi:hypothetical protein
MIPGLGPSCDLCTPEFHYLLTCPTCGEEWDEPPTPGKFDCPKCATQVHVTLDEAESWETDVLGIEPV